eukprot:m51a1_g5845 hypothetical protein (240) ;mRNA; f:318291-319190
MKITCPLLDCVTSFVRYVDLPGDADASRWSALARGFNRAFNRALPADTFALVAREAKQRAEKAADEERRAREKSPAAQLRALWSAPPTALARASRALRSLPLSEFSALVDRLRGAGALGANTPASTEAVAAVVVRMAVLQKQYAEQELSMAYCVSGGAVVRGGWVLARAADGVRRVGSTLAASEAAATVECVQDVNGGVAWTMRLGRRAAVTRSVDGPAGLLDGDSVFVDGHHYVVRRA